ncbi:PfkB family carbohydrate kinase [Providencia vermicola]|uniref:PfkB family carbohydrate kinase n=1 Tax=Providencia vermicola TaxID=333965 RepID=UPI001CEDE814|nr:PfkB family carbohydrate kinase [Providencia vermicola]
MKPVELIDYIPNLTNQRSVCVVGAAVIDVIADAYSLPYRGSDIELHQQSVNIGGCALNIAFALHRLGINSINALPIGQGIWADIIRNNLSKNGVSSVIETDEGDNGWCLALVEPDGERTFLSISGVENHWDRSLLDNLSIQNNTIVYLSGYQLAAKCGEVLLSWAESISDKITLFIDFGPRIADLSSTQLARLMALSPIISLNRQEVEHISILFPEIAHNKMNIEELADIWFKQYGCSLIVRVDKEGAFYQDNQSSGWVLPFETTVVDTIGAGDSHAGGVIAALASGWSMRDAVLLGNAVASYVVSHRGGDCAPFTAQLRTYLQQY